MAKPKSTRIPGRGPAALPTKHLAFIAQQCFEDMFKQMFEACMSHNSDAELGATFKACLEAWTAELRRRESSMSRDLGVDLSVDQQRGRLQ